MTFHKDTNSCRSSSSEESTAPTIYSSSCSYQEEPSAASPAPAPAPASGGAGERSKNHPNMESLFCLPTFDVADRLNAMLATERKPHYQCRDYLHRHPSSSSRRSSSSRCSRRSGSSRISRSSSSKHQEDSSSSSSSCSAVSKACRAKIVQWLYDCVDYLELPRECVAVAMSYVDRFMSNSNSSSQQRRSSSEIDNSSSSNHQQQSQQKQQLRQKLAKTIAQAKSDATIYQLVAISSLFLAAKSSDKLCPVDARVLARMSHGSYSAAEIVDTELLLVEALEWRLCGPTCWNVAQHVIALLRGAVEGCHRNIRHRRNQHSSRKSPPNPTNDDDRTEERMHSVIDFTRLQIELSVSDYATSVLRAPSRVALAAVLNSVELLDFTSHEKRAFGRSVAEWTATTTMMSVEDSEEDAQSSGSRSLVMDVHSEVELLDFTSHEKRAFGRSVAEWTATATMMSVEDAQSSGGSRSLVMDVHSEDVALTRMELQRVFDRQSNNVMNRASSTSSDGTKAAPSSSSRSNNNNNNKKGDDDNNNHKNKNKSLYESSATMTTSASSKSRNSSVTAPAPVEELSPPPPPRPPREDEAVECLPLPKPSRNALRARRPPEPPPALLSPRAAAAAAAKPPVLNDNDNNDNNERVTTDRNVVVRRAWMLPMVVLEEEDTDTDTTGTGSSSSSTIGPMRGC
eukprot:CAMPEP_0183743822 /NCGR_PEP_ID=MMETSP0737-20130205/65416_1 /TAXON_ID=385413 /ORGANISM="Thalassiosira miniscula, Strain CCMP1093" /LENGTH=682 /DNA_ID=CAMNT_0025979451 /DNA_START=230 /DNA_END=2280 /DNA_ORIENTATION=-